MLVGTYPLCRAREMKCGNSDMHSTEEFRNLQHELADWRRFLHENSELDYYRA